MRALLVALVLAAPSQASSAPGENDAPATADPDAAGAGDAQAGTTAPSAPSALAPGAAPAAVEAAAAAPAPSAADAVAQGSALYAASCTVCHGAVGRGNGPAALVMRPRPTDFTAPGWLGGRSDAALVSAIRSGRPGTSMRAYTELTDAEAAAIVVFLRTLEKSP